MKKLHFTLIALFMMFMAQAQTLTDKDLLGEWKLVMMDFDGVLVNFETNEVTADESAANSSEIDDLRAMMEGGMSDKAKSNKVAFKPGFVFESSEGDKTQTGSYKLATDGIRQVLLIDTPEKMTIDISLKDDLLTWVLPSSQTFKMYFRKVE